MENNNSYTPAHYRRVNLRTSNFKWAIAVIAMVSAFIFFMPPFTRALNKMYDNTSLNDNQKYWITFMIQLILYMLFIRLLLW